jgi:hypothetical protein
MPDPGGKLNPQESEAAIAWLQERWTIKICPFHGPTNWSIGDMIMTLPFSGGGVNIGGPTYPLIPVICSQCGYTVLINAIVAGIVALPAATATEAEAAPAQSEAEGG